MKDIYQAHSVVLVPGSGTSGMESIARQFANGKRCLYLRHGYFGYRWEEILTQGKISSHLTTLLGKSVNSNLGTYGPHPIEEVEKAIAKDRPEIVFFSHVDTSTGILVNGEYIKRVVQASKGVGALVVLDCIASGALWINMKELGVDIVVTAPQKGLSSQASSGVVMFNEKIRKNVIDSTQSSSYSLDLKRWLNVMENFEQGNAVYHATPPTDAIMTIASGLKDTVKFGIDKAKQTQEELGSEVRKMLAERGLQSVAAPGFEAPSVIVFHTREDPVAVVNRFKQAGIRVGGSLAFMLEEKEKPKTFRIGMLGIDKMINKNETLSFLKTQFMKVFPNK